MATAPLGKELASNDKKVRDAAVLSLRRFLVATTEKPMDKLEVTKLWKGIFYCFWMSDKPLVQQELSAELAELLLDIPTPDASLNFLRGFWEAIIREWSGLDYTRLDKYYMLVRKFVNASFRLLVREEWSPAVCEEYNHIIGGHGGPLYTEDTKIPTGLKHHLADLYGEELENVMKLSPESTPVPLATLLTPLFLLNALSPSLATHTRLHSTLFTPLFSALLQHSQKSDLPSYRSTILILPLSPHDDDRPRRKRARIEPPELPFAALIKNSCLTAEAAQKVGEEGTDEENTAPKPLSPDELRRGLLRTMFDIASGEDTKDASRKRMYRAWKDAIELAGEAPHEGSREV